MRIPRWRVIVALVLAASLAAVVGIAAYRLVTGGAQAETSALFYEVADDLIPGEPGTIIRSERMFGAPPGSIAWRVVYRSTDDAGATIAVSGIVVAPLDYASGASRPVLAWAHPTTGSDVSCAPSLSEDPFHLIPGIDEFLEAGYVVAATDYPGMGVAGENAYLIGQVEGHSVLDSVRAAEAIPGAHASNEAVIWGFSQGGQAALFSAQVSADYAPELAVHGVAVAAPVADIGVLLTDDIDDVSGVTIGSYAFQSYASHYGPTFAGATLETVLTPEGVAAVPAINDLCLLTDRTQLHQIAEPLVGTFLAADPTQTAPWNELLALNTPDAAGAVPLFIAQGSADTLVQPAETAKFAAAACASGRSVDVVILGGVTHGLAGEDSVPQLLDWVSTLGEGAPASKGC
ncbi:lipase family protein [soil metagenome]